MQTLQDQQWQRGDWEYHWNANGSLRSVKLPDGEIVSYEYDALGRRTKKLVNGKIKRYLWDGNVLLHEWEYDKTEAPRRVVNKLGEVSFDKPDPINNLITWVYETGSFVPCAKIVGNETFSIVNDYIGRPILAFDEKGEKVWSTDYDIYGNLRTLKGDREFIPFRQLGQYEDCETRLYYNRFRYYNPETGTYISKDPISILGGLNVYAYVKNTNRFIDIFGLDCSSNIIKDSKGNELDLSIFENLIEVNSPIKGGRGGTKIPLEGNYGTFANLQNGHKIVYDSNNRAIFDVSKNRIKKIEWNQAPSGEFFPKKGSDTKIFVDEVPEKVLELLNF